MACQFISSYFPPQPNKKLLELSFNQPFPRNEIAQSRNSLEKLRPATKDLCVLNWHRLLRNACFLAEANVLQLQTRTKPLLSDLPGTAVGLCSGQVAQSNCFKKKQGTLLASNSHYARNLLIGAFPSFASVF